MKPSEIQTKINIARGEATLWQKILDQKSCHDCNNFQSGACLAAGGVQPPEEVQKVGCPEWNYDEIPF